MYGSCIEMQRMLINDFVQKFTATLARHQQRMIMLPFLAAKLRRQIRKQTCSSFQVFLRRINAKRTTLPAHPRSIHPERLLPRIFYFCENLFSVQLMYRQPIIPFPSSLTLTAIHPKHRLLFSATAFLSPQPHAVYNQPEAPLLRHLSHQLLNWSPLQITRALPVLRTRKHTPVVHHLHKSLIRLHNKQLVTR